MISSEPVRKPEREPENTKRRTNLRRKEKDDDALILSSVNGELAYDYLDTDLFHMLVRFIVWIHCCGAVI